MYCIIFVHLNLSRNVFKSDGNIFILMCFHITIILRNIIFNILIMYIN